MTSVPIRSLLERALASRVTLFDARHESAFRLFNGFTEGNPHLVVDLYARTLLLHDYTDDPTQSDDLVQDAIEYLRNLPLFAGWLRAVVVKIRNGKTQQDKRGRLLFGEKSDDRIKEHGVWYSVDLTMNRDASFYLDTRILRKWLMDHGREKTVLNMFAYTGSLGVAALAGGASRVVQQDRSRQFLNIAKTSYTLNGTPINKQDFITSDFFETVGKFKRAGQTFDCVLLDPPFFSSTAKGRVDQETEGARLINKVRPLINDGGCLVAINNALYVSGDEYMRTLEALCSDGYLAVKELIPVPEDIAGYTETRTGSYITDPAPFNHSTKIAVLEIQRK